MRDSLLHCVCVREQCAGGILRSSVLGDPGRCLQRGENSVELRLRLVSLQPAERRASVRVRLRKWNLYAAFRSDAWPDILPASRSKLYWQRARDEARYRLLARSDGSTPRDGSPNVSVGK